MPASSSTVSETIAAVHKYIGQFKKESKIGHALRQLNRLPLTEPILTETAVGRAVNSVCDHPEHGQLARDLLEKWIAIVAEAKGIVMDAPKPVESRKRPASDGLTAESGLSFEEALRVCAVPPPAKKLKLIVKHAPAPTAELKKIPAPTPITSNESTPVAAPEEADGLFVIERKHTQSRVYSGKLKASDVASPRMHTIASLLQNPSTATFKEVESALERCTVEQLERIELLNPQWLQQTEIIWRGICLREFPGATARDTFSWRLCYQRHIQQHEDHLAAITAKINKSDAVQPKSMVPLIPVKQKKVQTASSSHRAPLAPINGSRTSRPSAPAKSRPAPLMAKAIKMMNNRHRR
uniref:TFIIS N-terminal domain-containing protein n=1 Tax=Panagrellus redivivus TaxID=6233 RepID=A0A7E4W3Q1_PANRE